MRGAAIIGKVAAFVYEQAPRMSLRFSALMSVRVSAL